MSAGRVHRIDSSAHTRTVGRIERDASPVVRVASGDEVVLSTDTHFGDAVGPEATVAELERLREAATWGPHTLTGPIEVETARAGAVLQVDVLELVPRCHGFNSRLPGRLGRGLLPDRFEEPEVTHFDLDLDTMTTRLGRHVIPLRPFLGFVGVLPVGDGPWSSRPPGRHGGNLDLKLLVEGATLFLPVLVDGARLWVGDGHAAQGDGEVNLTAIEVAFERVRLRLTVRDDLAHDRPVVHTDEHLVVLGFGASLDDAAGDAVAGLLDVLQRTYDVPPDRGYTLCSVAGDLAVTQVVNGVRGVHVKLPWGVLGR